MTDLKTLTSLSFLQSLPKSILKFIIDKLTFYQCYALGSCNKFWYNLTLNSENFWEYRLGTDFDSDITVDGTYKVGYKVFIEHLRAYFKLFEDDTINFYGLLQARFATFDFGQFAVVINDIIKCHLYTDVDKKICSFIANVVNGEIPPFTHESLVRGFLTYLMYIEFLWSGKVIQEIFGNKFLHLCTGYDCVEIIQKCANRKGSIKINIGINMLDQIVQRMMLRYLVRDETLNKCLELIDTEIEYVTWFIRTKGTKSIPAQIHNLIALVIANVHRDTVLMMINRLLTRISKMPHTIAVAIYRNLLLHCTNHPMSLQWLLSYPLVPELDLDVLSTFKTQIRKDADLTEYKNTIKVYIDRHPNCISELGYRKLMNISVINEFGLN